LLVLVVCRDTARLHSHNDLINHTNLNRSTRLYLRLLGISHVCQARSKTSITSADTSVERASHHPSRAYKHDRRFHAASRAEAYRVVFLSTITTNSVPGPCSPKPGSLIAVSSREAAYYPHASCRQSITHRITHAALTETTPYPLSKYLLQSVDTQNTSQWKTRCSLLLGVDLVSSRGWSKSSTDNTRLTITTGAQTTPAGRPELHSRLHYQNQERDPILFATVDHSLSTYR
jgi:hypothetical protein